MFQRYVTPAKAQKDVKSYVGRYKRTKSFCVSCFGHSLSKQNGRKIVQSDDFVSAFVS